MGKLLNYEWQPNKGFVHEYMYHLWNLLIEKVFGRFKKKILITVTNKANIKLNLYRKCTRYFARVLITNNFFSISRKERKNDLLLSKKKKVKLLKMF